MHICEWWEVWWKKPGAKPVQISSGWPASETGAPAGTFCTLQAAKDFHKKHQNRFYKIKHVRRFKVRKRYCWYYERDDGTYFWWHGHDYAAVGLQPYWHLRGDNATRYRTIKKAMKDKPHIDGYEVKLHTYFVKVKET